MRERSIWEMSSGDFSRSMVTITSASTINLTNTSSCINRTCRSSVFRGHTMASSISRGQQRRTTGSWPHKHKSYVCSLARHCRSAVNASFRSRSFATDRSAKFIERSISSAIGRNASHRVNHRSFTRTRLPLQLVRPRPVLPTSQSRRRKIVLSSCSSATTIILNRSANTFSNRPRSGISKPTIRPNIWRFFATLLCSYSTTS